MTVQSRNYLRGKFEQGDKPTGTDFSDLIDSYARAGSAANAVSEIVISPGTSTGDAQSYMGGYSSIKVLCTAQNVASLGYISKGRNTSVASSHLFYASGNFGRELLMYLESTGVNATADRQISFEPGFSGTGQFPSIRSEGIGTFGTDPDIPFGVLARGKGYIGFYTHCNGGQHSDPGGGDVLQVMITDTASALHRVQLTGGSAASDPSIFAHSTNAANVDLTIGAQGNGAIKFITNSNTYQVSGNPYEQFRIMHVASAENRIAIQGAQTGAVPVVRALSSANANSSIGIASQGTGNVNCFTSGSRLQARITHTANASNFIDITGAASASPVTITANGEADVGISLVVRGSAYVQYGTVVADAGINNTGYIRIRDAGGTIRRIAIASGS